MEKQGEEPMKILNLTRGEITPEQELEGAVELRTGSERSRIRDLAVFADPPSRHVMLWRAAEIVRLLGKWGYVPGMDAAMIGGSPYFLPYLAAALRKEGVTPLHAFARPAAGGEAKDRAPGRRKAVFVEDPSRFDLSFSRQ